MDTPKFVSETAPFARTSMRSLPSKYSASWARPKCPATLDVLPCVSVLQAIEEVPPSKLYDACKPSGLHALNCPAAQIVQCDEDGIAYLPPGHNAHAETPAPEYFPPGHSVQLVDSVVFELTSPELQSMHCVEDELAANLPPGHAEQRPVLDVLDTRTPEVYLPAGQVIQTLEPTVSAYLPPSHSEHEDAVVPEYMPFPQIKHDAAVEPEYWPPSHDEHDDEIAPANFPLGQLEQLETPAIEYLPAGHALQLLDPITKVLYCPALQSMQTAEEG